MLSIIACIFLRTGEKSAHFLKLKTFTSNNIENGTLVA